MGQFMMKLATIIRKQKQKYSIIPELHCALRLLVYLLMTIDKYHRITWLLFFGFRELVA